MMNNWHNKDWLISTSSVQNKLVNLVLSEEKKTKSIELIVPHLPSPTYLKLSGMWQESLQRHAASTTISEATARTNQPPV